MGKTMKVEGIIPAMLTPFTEKGEVDVNGIKENVDFFIEGGVSGIMCNGSTGEATALTPAERIKVIETTVEAVRDRVKVIAGSGAPTTKEAVELTKEAKSAGAYAVMIVTPYYAIPTQEGLYKYYETIAKTVDIPIVIYNIPPHTNVEIQFNTLERLVEIDNIVALKDSSGNLSYFAEVMLRVGGKIGVLTGSDDITLPCFALGCHGAILALCNIAPRMVVDLYHAVQKREMEKALQLYYQLLPIARAISTSENFPAPLKEAVRMLGHPAGPVRSPIMPVAETEKASIREALKATNLL